MRFYCGDNISKSDDDRAENINRVKSEVDHLTALCRSYCEKKDSMIRLETPSLAPTTSMSSSDRSFSSGFSVDGNPYDRGIEEECSSHSSQDEMDSVTQNWQQNSKVKDSDSSMHSSSMVTEISDISSHGDILRDVEISQSDNQDSKDNGAENVQGLSDQEFVHDNHQAEAGIWDPPEPETPDDESEGGVADIDDDDDEEECCHDTKWGKSSFLGDKDENSKSLKLKEEKQRTMQDVINKKFKVIVRQLLKSVGVSSSAKDSENWIDIVTELSWEAASLLTPVVIDGKPVDPDAYIKVKCIATGSCRDSQVFRGLVFKKHAAHKHMPTMYERPRIMLIQGVLGQPTSGLSSFKSMVQEKDYVKPVVDMIEGCQPNVILVENSVSRDVQESVLDKGITLVFDMKLHRLERIARCIGSPIVSFDTMSNQKLKHCDSFRIEKIVEEHNIIGEGGKKPSKTLMFLEGFPTRLGCTILLKGSHSDELKKVKEVVQYAVVLAYHLILETSFIIDQQTMFSTAPLAGVIDVAPGMKSPIPEMGKSAGSILDDSTSESDLNEINIPISNGFHGESSNAIGNTNDDNAQTRELDRDSVFSYEPYNPAIFVGFSSLSASLKRVIEGRLTSGPLSKYFGLVENPEAVPVSVDADVPDNYEFEATQDSGEDTMEKDAEKENMLVESGNSVSTKIEDGNSVPSDKDIETALDSQSILVLMSRRNSRRGIICEQNHFSHILFYKNFDVPLGRFLRDMFNQGSRCNTCEEFPEMHVYYYAHRNRQLTIQIKRLSSDRSMPGGEKGKIWMWSRCGKCKTQSGTPKSTKRVLISTAARSLSFGKFLELSFSQQSLQSRMSSCGHSFDWDFLYFFGLGSMVALFRYSKVTTYTIALPPQKLELGKSLKAGWLEKEFQDVFTKGISLFEEVTSSLKQVRSQLTSSSPNNQLLSDIEEMLKEERSEFEENIKNAFDKTKIPGDVSHKLLGLNHMRWELLLQALVWDRRLHSMVLPGWMLPSTTESGRSDQELKPKLDDSVVARTRFEANSDTNAIEGNETVDKEIQIYGTSIEDGDQTEVASNAPEDDEMQTLGGLSINTYHDSNTRTRSDGDLAHYKETDRMIPITRESEDSQLTVSHKSHVLGPERMHEWFWIPFKELRSRGIKDLDDVYLSKSDAIYSSTQDNLQTMHQIISDESSRQHITLGDDHSIVSDYEDELSSLIACALAHLINRPGSGDSSDEENRMPLMRSKHGSLEGFMDKDPVNSHYNIPREESRFLSFDGLTRPESLASREGLGRKISFGFLKSLEKCKYSVVCLYADKFRELRELCCPSELDYIASLSRCKPWDAKGGKSQSGFAKTLDDRFIIKEIKKTEYESFVKFAHNYFKYMKDSYESGNQTCLAKVLGIYQVTIKQAKSGKEIKQDLVVMENLSFGRKIMRQYDLKGALHARFIASNDDAEDVLLDQNFVNDMSNSPLYVSNTSKRILERAVWNDTSFLNSINVMDYSLLVGVDMEKRELVCGIIDYLRQYTWDKQLETWVKSSLVVPKNLMPTVISPKEYKKRFRKFMSAHFMCVPDDWCSTTEASDQSKEDGLLES